MPQTQTSWFDLPNGLLLTNGTVEIGVTTSIGPRIAAYRLKGGENILGRAVGTLDKPNEWHPWGGHRVWIGRRQVWQPLSSDSKSARNDRATGNSSAGMAGATVLAGLYSRARARLVTR